MLSFENINYLQGLLVVIPLALLFWGVLRWKAKTRKAFGDDASVAQLMRNYSSKLFIVKFVVVLIAIVCCVLALANLRMPLKTTMGKKGGIDVMIALDVSRSMWSKDVAPSRLAKAKQLIVSLIDELEDNRVGLIVFAGQAYLQMPLTNDIAMAKMFADNISSDMVPLQGTNIPKALVLCDQALDTKDKKYKAVVLISDGENHNPNAKDAAKQLRENGVVLYTVGVGTITGVPVMKQDTSEYKRDEKGNSVISKLNERELKDIATLTNGEYYYLDNMSTVTNNIITTLNSMEKKIIIDNAKQYKSFTPLILAIAILLLAAELFIPEVRKNKREK